MTALPRRFVSRLPRHTRLFRTCTLAQLEAMPVVDLDAMLALLWKRIEAANRWIPPPRNVADWKLDCIAAALEVLKLPPLPPPSAAVAKVMKNDRERFLSDLAGRVESREEEAKAYVEGQRERAREEYLDWRDGQSSGASAWKYRDPPAREDF